MANRDDDEKLSNETETVELSSEDENDADYNDDEKDSDTPKKKKGGLGKILGIAGAVVAVGAIVFTGNKIFFSDNSAPPAQNQSGNQQAPVPVESTPQPQPQAQVNQPQEQPQQAATTAPETAPVPQVSNGEEVLPDLHQGTVTAENPNSGSLGDEVTSTPATPEVKAPESTSVQTPVTPAEKTPAEPVAPVTQDVAPDLGHSEVQPMPSVGQNVTSNSAVHNDTTPAISNSSAGELNKSIQALIVKMDGLSTSIESLNNMIGDTNDRIDKTNTNVDNLSKRVDKLEDMLKNKPAVAAAGKDDCDNKATKPVVKKSSKAVVKKKRSSNVSSHSRYNSVEIIDEDAPRSHRKAYVAPKKASTASSRLGGGYTLQSVVTDRAWVKHPNGTTSTYGIGDRLPNGKIVGSIDPDNGVYDTNGKLVLK